MVAKMAVRLKELTAPAAMALEARMETGSAACASAAKPASIAAASEPPLCTPRRSEFPAQALGGAVDAFLRGVGGDAEGGGDFADG